MTHLSEHFTLEEFTFSNTAVSAGVKNVPLKEHYNNLLITAQGFEKIRMVLGNVPLIMTSGYRGPELNRLVGGVSDSDHCLGWAGDAKHSILSVRAAYNRIKDSDIQFDQLIYEFGRWFHVSFNPRMRRECLIAYKVGKVTHYRTDN